MKEKKKFTDKIKDYLKIGTVAGMTMMSTMTDAEAANNKQMPEKTTIKISEHVIQGQQYSTPEQELAALSLETAQLARKHMLLLRQGNQKEAETIKDKIDKLQEKRMYLMKQIEANKAEKEKFNERLKVDVSNVPVEKDTMSDEEFKQTIKENVNTGKNLKDPRFINKLQEMRRQQIAGRDR